MQRINRTHPLITYLWSDHKTGALSRRDFLRFSALLGLTTTASHLLQLAIPGHARGAVYGHKLRIAGQLPDSGHPAKNISIPASQVLRQVVEYLKTRTNKKGDLVHGDLDADYERFVR